MWYVSGVSGSTGDLTIWLVGMSFVFKISSIVDLGEMQWNGWIFADLDDHIWH